MLNASRTFSLFHPTANGIHEQYAVLNVWKTLIHSSISEDMLLIKQAMLIILMQTLKETAPNLKLISFPDALRKEVANVFRNFTLSQKEFIRLNFFVNPSLVLAPP